MRLILNSNNSEWTRMKKFNDFMLHSRRAKSSRVSVYFVRLKRMFSEIVCLDLIFHRFRPVYFSLILKRILIPLLFLLLLVSLCFKEKDQHSNLDS